VSVAEWVFRHAGGCLIDLPDLPATRAGFGWRWVATLWPDPLAADGWANLQWAAGERGWKLPVTLAIGDVLEFGVTSHDPSGRPINGCTFRWYGWLDHATDYAIIVRGPYRHPRPAANAARPAVDELRLNQLDPPIEAIIELIRLEQHPGR
jgi:hypothetical protein